MDFETALLKKRVEMLEEALLIYIGFQSEEFAEEAEEEKNKIAIRFASIMKSFAERYTK